MLRSPRSAFTLIELLVVIAIIAVLAVVVILTLNPAELLRQARDSNRFSDSSTLNRAVSLYMIDQGSSIGAASTTYISIPDPSATSTAGNHCEGLTLPTSTSGWTYHCAASSTYRNVDGTGWIPVNFRAISSGAPVGSLPVDPINTGNNYYTYVASGGSYEFTSIPESNKYMANAVNDGGYNPFIYEKGNDLTLSPAIRNQWTNVGDFEGGNNGFEQYGVGPTFGWSNAYGSVTGQGAEHVVAADSLTNGGSNYGGVQNTSFPTLTVGRKYGISLYAKTIASPDPVNNGHFNFMVQSGSGDSNCLSIDFDPTQQWAPYYTSCVLDAARPSLLIGVALPASVEFVIDNIQIVALN